MSPVGEPLHITFAAGAVTVGIALIVNADEDPAVLLVLGLLELR
jgi:hypothetical protein